MKAASSSAAAEGAERRGDDQGRGLTAADDRRDRDQRQPSGISRSLRISVARASGPDTASPSSNLHQAELALAAVAAVKRTRVAERNGDREEIVQALAKPSSLAPAGRRRPFAARSRRSGPSCGPSRSSPRASLAQAAVVRAGWHLR